MTVPVPHLPSDIDELARHIRQPDLPTLARQFLYEQLFPESKIDAADVPLDQLPRITSRVRIYASASAVYYAPSDSSGARGMLRKQIRSTWAWRRKGPRCDCVYAERDPDAAGFRGLHIARVLSFFSFSCNGVNYPCALVRWFSPVSDEPCRLTGMWIVEPDKDQSGDLFLGVIHINTILCGAHLIPVYGDEAVPRDGSVSHTNALDLYSTYYVNKYIDHHSHETAF